MRKSILRASAALQALALLGAGATAFVAAAPASAQDYTSGGLSGSVSTESGAPVAGAAVTVRSVQQGSVRTTRTDSNGGFTVSSLPAGDYDVTVTAGGNRSFQATAVNVVSGQTSSIPITLASAAGNIVVTGRRIQAFTGTTTGLNVDVEQIKQIVPVGRSLTSVILLAPSTTRGDTAFGNLASIGGGSVAENAYYVNGLNTTNFDNYLGSAEVPFDFYKSVEVKAGGYPAEFGRATGGIVNAITKAGTNDWTAAMHVNWAPEGLRSDNRDLLNCSDTSTGVQCDPTTNRHFDYDKSLNITAEAGGPIFRDRLFVYGLLQMNDRRYRSINTVAETAYEYKNTDPFWGAKIDAIPIDGHHFEFTIFDTRNTLYRSDVVYSDTNPGTSRDNPEFGIASSVSAFHGGGLNYVGKYTGRLTDFFTISGAYGRMRDRFDYGGVAGAAGLPFIRNSSGLDYTDPTTGNILPNGGYLNGQRVSSYQDPYKTERKFYRADIDVLAHFVGDHHFRAGIDQENNTLTEHTFRSGGETLCDPSIQFISVEACTLNGGGGAYFLLRGGGGPTATKRRIEVNYYNSAGSFKGKNQAIYLEDEWRPTDRLTINAGIRRDNFQVNSITGDPYISLKNNWAPRIGLTYDVGANKSGRFKLFYGQYYLPLASNTAFRQSGREYYFRERYNLLGFDARGLPILGSQVTTIGSYQSSCPFILVPGHSSGEFCSVTGRGVVPAGQDAISASLKATKESEFIAGYEQRLGRWKVGVNFIHRSLLATSEDSAIDAAALAYCQAQGILNTVNPDTGYTCAEYYTGYAQYVIANPGSDIIVNLPGVQGDPQVTLKAADLGYPKARRTYDAVELTFDKPYDGVWSLGGSYTWSKSKGNSEGFVQSDFGQDDAGITQDFDQPGFVPGSYGFLPNDRRHRFKIYGAYTFFNAFTVGGNFTLESPRPLSCFGFNPLDVFANGYGAASRYCGGVLSPRGTAQKTAWVNQLDMKFAYKMTVPTGQQMTLRADVFNVFNSKAVQKRYEFGDLDYDSGPDGLPIKYYPDPNYGQATNYQNARSVRLGLDIMFGGVAAPIVAPPVVIAPPPPPPPAMQTCPDGSMIAADAMCPVPPPPPPPPPAPVERGERGQ
ncbi:MAG: carboxypeptidase regulatory-like domain-containing protein [Sphingomicrobium sp.]